MVRICTLVILALFTSCQAKIRGPKSAQNQVTVDRTAPAAATALTWLEASPAASTTLTASWTKSSATDLSNQYIQFYSDSSCGAVSGVEINLASGVTQKRLQGHIHMSLHSLLLWVQPTMT